MNNGTSRLEQLIDDIYEFVDSCKTAALSSNRIIVPKDELLDLLDELRLRTPDEIKKYQKIVANRDMILSNAESKAASIITEAEEKAARLVSEHEITQQAYQQANELVKQANEEASRINEQVKRNADEITSGALAYTNDLLDMAEEVLSTSYKDAKASFDTMLNTLNNSLNVVRENKKEMAVTNGPKETTIEGLEDDFEFDSDTFMDGIDE